MRPDVLPAGWEDLVAPGAGALPPAAAVETTAPSVSLDGDWQFRWTARRTDAPAMPGEHAEPGHAYADRVTVPGHWVLQGGQPAGRGPWGSPWYTNVNYPFPVDPPFVPDDSAVGDHRVEFTLPGPDDADHPLHGWQEARALLARFDGVDGADAVWVNGTPVGWATGSRLVHEFDVAPHAHPGVNVLQVRVHRFSAASYLEDQDQWWLPGIFRPVTLRLRPRAGIDDVDLAPDLDPGTGAGILDVTVTAPADAFPARLHVPELGVDVTLGAHRQRIEVGPVQAWSDDAPRRYTVHVEAPGETVTLRTGFRRIEIRDAVLLANGRPVRLRGVNRHEFHPRTGRAVTEEFTRAELIRMKRHNINAIRTSHYPPAHHLLELADELGLWVIDECDLETHGFVHQQWRRNPSDDPAWRDAYLDRIARTWERDKNHPCLVMVSLGNESGTGANLAAMSAWLKGRGCPLPVHYEGDRESRYTDVYSRMYPTYRECEHVLAGELVPSVPDDGQERLATRPFVLCEYGHAMGNGPGGLARYEQLIDRYPRFAGGFVWEWKDHGIATATVDGTPYWAHGGDFGEPVHDGTFVLDGVCFPDGTPSPALLDLRSTFAPVRITVGDDGRVTVRNRNTGVDTGYLRFTWRLEVDGVAIAAGDLPLAAVAAGDTGIAAVPDLGVPGLGDDGAGDPGDHRPGDVAPGRTSAAAGTGAPVAVHPESWLVVTAALAADAAWAPAGHVVAVGQGRLAGPPPGPAPVAAVAATGGADAPDPGGDTDPGPRGTVRRIGIAGFSAGGELLSLGNLPVLGVGLALDRAPTDNDRGTIEPTRDTRRSDRPGFDWDADAGTDRVPVAAATPWAEHRLGDWQRRTVAVHGVATAAPDAALTRVERWGEPAGDAAARVTTTWRPTPGGVSLTVTITPEGSAVERPLPVAREGIVVTLPAGPAAVIDTAVIDTAVIDTVQWFGPGPQETYADTAIGARVGRHRLPLDEFITSYPSPQENGNRRGVRWLQLLSDAGADADDRAPVLTVRVLAADSVDGWLNVNVQRHTPAQLAAADHPHELPPSDVLHLHLDVAQHGIGSRSCGVDVEPEHRVTLHEATFTVEFLTPSGGTA
ncbi:beta-galactosidase [Tersicoccus solisilvae]|uniref:beta-galactosidase n=1 Tax=Tersicoccus solisilvae TaxID=1882339 RepID=A0ABQ1P812_9MICC|nr:glycoside hydrolase family 2 TIM barrel-domain containing protein [Tersicoccus solisilvae]GGC92450.1 beta-galactosidase [Tersicoccus solisilvae]